MVVLICIMREVGHIFIWLKTIIISSFPLSQTILMQAAFYICPCERESSDYVPGNGNAGYVGSPNLRSHQ